MITALARNRMFLRNSCEINLTPTEQLERYLQIHIGGMNGLAELGRRCPVCVMGDGTGSVLMRV